MKLGRFADGECQSMLRRASHKTSKRSRKAAFGRPFGRGLTVPSICPAYTPQGKGIVLATKLSWQTVTLKLFGASIALRRADLRSA